MIIFVVFNKIKYVRLTLSYLFAFSKAVHRLYWLVGLLKNCNCRLWFGKYPVKHLQQSSLDHQTAPEYQSHSAWWSGGCRYALDSHWQTRCNDGDCRKWWSEIGITKCDTQMHWHEMQMHFVCIIFHLKH